MIASELKDRVVLVTGGVSGMGEACTRRLQELGAVAVAVDRDADRGERFVAGLDSRDGVEFNPVDITDRDALDALVGDVRQRHGRLDAVINCAGIFTANAAAADVPIEDFRRNFEVNVLGTMLTCQAAFPLLAKDGGGAIVNVASQAALVSLPEQAAYTASKGAVAALTRSLAIDWSPSQVRVNAICPGFTRTPMSEPAITPELLRAIERRVPLGRMFDAVEMANAMLFLASPLASAISGVVMAVDGGWTAGEAELPQW